MKQRNNYQLSIINCQLNKDQVGTTKALIENIDGMPQVTNRYIYGPYGEPLNFSNDAERQGFIGKEKDLESGLADHGVRKYDYISGRFTSVDVLSEKFYGLSPYQYAGNNPVSLLDGNGKWFWSINGDKYQDKSYWNGTKNQKFYTIGFNSSKIQSQSNKLVSNWQSIAPNVANFAISNSIKIVTVGGMSADEGGETIPGDLSTPILINAFKNSIGIEPTLFHETVHKMGYNEYGAWSAMLAAGLITREELKDQLIADIGYITKGSKQDYYLKLTKKEITYDQIIDSMLIEGQKIIGVTNNE
ncbi:MAG: hypothetical protein A2X64_10875 [Ignavibacteria bacterium GWF2_33_9]|nr:MAG: hypothetical protein A2X64_10875 [Ignavibacteria bacterium GWF2_33_9]